MAERYCRSVRSSMKLRSLLDILHRDDAVLEVRADSSALDMVAALVKV
jgi:hypothetical protein